MTIITPDPTCLPLSCPSSFSFCVGHCPAPPSASLTPSEPLLSVGDPLTLTCTGGDCVGTTTFTFSWLLDGSPVDTTSLVTDINSTVSQLSVTSMTSADFGTHTCQVTSVHGTGTAVSYVRETGQLSWAFHLLWLCMYVHNSASHAPSVLTLRQVRSTTQCASGASYTECVPK